MSEIILKCINHVISVVNTPDISSGNVNYDTVLFELCPNWTGFTKTAVFYRSEDEVYYQMLDSDNRCTIPKEVLREKGKIRIGLFGVKDNTTITSDVVTYNVSQGAITTGLKPSDPTQDIYAQLIGQYSDLGAEIDVERKRIDSIVSGATVDANAELIDIRVGADGTVYGSAGDAVRSQFKKIKEVNSLAIVNEASGKEIIATDSSDNDFKNLKVYGETTQRLGKNLIKCDAPVMGIGNEGITYKGVYETPFGEGELQYIEVSGTMEPLNMNNGTTEVATIYTIGEVTLGAGEYIFSQGFTTGTRYPHLVLYLDGVEHSNLLTAPEKSFTLTKSTVVRLDIEVLAVPNSEIPTTNVYPMIRLASETDGTYEPYNGVTPTPENPKAVRGVKGKNELDCSGLVPQTTAGITFTPVYDKGLLSYININGTWDSSNSATNTRYKLGTWFPKSKGKYILSGMSNIGDGSFLCMDKNGAGGDYEAVASTSNEFTVSDDAEFYDVYLRIANGTSVNNLKVYPMIRDASITDGTYAPYDCVRFTDTGKNLLEFSQGSTTSNGITFTVNADKSVTVNGTATADAVLLLTTSTRGEVDLKSLTGKNLILNGCPKDGSSTTYKFQFWSASKMAVDTGKGATLDLSTVPDTWNFAISIISGTTVNNLTFKPMIRLASITDDTYEPFNGIETANLSGIELHGLGDARDYIDLERGVIVRKCGVNTFDGSESWSGSSFLSGRYGYTLRAKKNGKCICTMAKNATNDLFGYCHLNQAGAFYINTSFATVNEWKAHLQANSMTVVYELATPIEEPLSDANLQALRELHSYKPTTILTNDAGAYMELEYVADTKLYIDKRISELATAILNN